jgi:hypothetical protein
MLGLGAAILALGCDSTKSNSFQGDWMATGSLSPYALSVTQTGQRVAGNFSLASNGFTYGTITGTDANGDVTFAIATNYDLFGGVQPTFTGHFTDANTVVGVLSSDFGAAQLTRVTR